VPADQAVADTRWLRVVEDARCAILSSGEHQARSCGNPAARTAKEPANPPRRLGRRLRVSGVLVRGWPHCSDGATTGDAMRIYPRQRSVLLARQPQSLGCLRRRADVVRHLQGRVERRDAPTRLGTRRQRQRRLIFQLSRMEMRVRPNGYSALLAASNASLPRLRHRAQLRRPPGWRLSGADPSRLPTVGSAASHKPNAQRTELHRSTDKLAARDILTVRQE
jgi:hypothetical protein